MSKYSEILSKVAIIEISRRFVRWLINSMWIKFHPKLTQVCEIMAKPDIIYKNKKKEVRRIYVREAFFFHTTQQDAILHTATEKETIMGLDLVAKAYVSNAGLTNNYAVQEARIYVASNGAPVVCNIADVLDSETKSKEMERITLEVSDMIPDIETIKNKKKRKMSKGEVLYLSQIANAIEANARVIVSGYIYIGD